MDAAMHLQTRDMGIRDPRGETVARSMGNKVIHGLGEAKAGLID